jgi:hypothetical protein
LRDKKYYAPHPQTKCLTRVTRAGKILKSYTKKSDARRHIAEMIQIINAKLAGGLSPFLQFENKFLTLHDGF